MFERTVRAFVQFIDQRGIFDCSVFQQEKAVANGDGRRHIVSHEHRSDAFLFQTQNDFANFWRAPTKWTNIS